MRDLPERRWLECVSLVFMGRIGRDCNIRAIIASFTKFRPIVDIFIPTKLRVCKGFAFVWFKHARNVEYLLKSNSEFWIEGMKVTLDWARSPPRFGFPAAARVVNGARVSHTVEPNLTGKHPLHAPYHFFTWVGKVPLVSSHSFKEALLSLKEGAHKVEAFPNKTDELMNKKTLNFSYVKRSTGD